MRVTVHLRLALVAIALAGCGEGEATTPVYGESQAGPLSRAEFIRQADEICRFSQTTIEASADELANTPGGPGPAQIRRVALEVVVPRLTAQIDAIRALGAPAVGAAQVEAILAATEEGITAIEADPEALADGPPPALRRAGRLSRRFGAEVCGLR